MSGTLDGGERGRLGSPVDAHTRLFAIIGDPIDHVRAPVVWSALFGRFGIAWNCRMHERRMAPTSTAAMTGSSRPA